MSYLFLIDERKKTVLHPFAIKLCPELAVLTEKEILFLIFAFDYDSPFKQFPERQRLSKAIIHVYGDNVPDLLDEDRRPKKIKLAIEAYKSLQYDSNQELIATYQKKIEMAQSQILEEDAPSRLKNLRDIISGFRNDIRELQTEVVAKSVLQAELKGDRELSLLEDMMASTKRYNAVRYGK
jgi:DNA-binding TFAR19-related protein (PDSD5 family)